MSAAPQSGASVGWRLTPASLILEGRKAIYDASYFRFLRPRRVSVTPPAIFASFLTQNFGHGVRGVGLKYMSTTTRCAASVGWLLMPRGVVLEGSKATFGASECGFLRPRRVWFTLPTLSVFFLIRNSGSTVTGTRLKFAPRVPRTGACVSWLLMPPSLAREGFRLPELPPIPDSCAREGFRLTHPWFLRPSCFET